MKYLKCFEKFDSVDMEYILEDIKWILIEISDGPRESIKRPQSNRKNRTYNKRR